MHNHLNRNAISFVLLLSLLLIIAVGCEFDQQTTPPQVTTMIPSASLSPTPLQPQVESSPSLRPSNSPISNEVHVTKVKLAAVGDVLIHSSIYKDAKTTDGYDFIPMFAEIKQYIEEADLAMANQESMLGGVGMGLSDYPRFNSPYEVGDALKATGFDIVNLANNHTLDRGEQAVINTINHFNDLGIIYTGAHLSVEDQRRIRIVEKNGISFAFLSYTYGTNGIPIPEGKDYLVNLIDLPILVKDIGEARKFAEVVVVNVHFGQEYIQMPNNQQKEFALAAAEAGADIIIGHHPHVLQPMEWIQTTSGRKTFVVYSLGNFIAAQEGNRNRTGGILQLEVEKTVSGGITHINVQHPSFIPTWITMTNWRKYKIVPLWDAPESQLPNGRSFLQVISSHMNQWMPELFFPQE